MNKDKINKENKKNKEAREDKEQSKKIHLVSEEDVDQKTDQDANKEEMITISKKEYEELQKAKDSQQKLLYAYAEFENYKKRAAKDLEQQICYANERLIKEVLPIIDNLSRAKEHADNCENINPEQFQKFLEGIDLVLKQLTASLKKFGVEEVCSLGEKFDPNYHEAMDHRESKDHDNGVVIDEYQKGYTMNGRLIRPSKVGVSIKKKKEEDENE
jgi:molecular chaperone GrpE